MNAEGVRSETAGGRAGAWSGGGRFDVLEHDDGQRETEDGSDALRPALFRGAGGRVLRRLAAELVNWYRVRRDQLPAEPPEFAHRAERAEEFKLLIYEFCDPSSGGDISLPTPKVKFVWWGRDALWGRIALSRLRFCGSKRTYVVCRADHRQRRREARSRRGLRAACVTRPSPSAVIDSLMNGTTLSRDSCGGVATPSEGYTEFGVGAADPYGQFFKGKPVKEPGPKSLTQSRKLATETIDPAYGRGGAGGEESSEPAPGRRVLVLHPPERSSVAAAYDPEHAARQASFGDNADGIFAKGLRVDVAALRRAGAPLEELERVRRGYELLLREWPRQYHGRHYGGAADHPDKLQHEHERMLARNFVEGPLLYVPWVVQSLGGVWREDKAKWRTIVDATSSGVNPACLPMTVRYDMLEDAIRGMTPRCRLSSFDLTDAFLNWPYLQSHSELFGYRDTRGDYFRYRFLGFGGAQSPAVQQRWALIIKDLLNRVGLRYCSGRAADYSGFAVVMGYMDDFACVHAEWLTPAEADEQFASVLRVLEDLGLEDKPSKRSPPAMSLEILGFLVDTAEQTVTVTERRCAQLVDEISVFLSSADADVGRREMASLVGKLQWVAQILQGGQLHLRRAYRARDDFVEPPGESMRERWGRGVRVWRTAGLLSDLRWWRRELPRLRGRKLFLANMTVANGFWRGALGETDELLDARDGVSHEDVEVITTDASGYGAGGWWRRRRAAWYLARELRAPRKSSNYRELLTVVLVLERWGGELAALGRRVLIRTDNTVTVKVVNSGDSGSPLLEPLARRLHRVVEQHGLQVAARHIPGLKNGLSDALSRWRESPLGADARRVAGPLFRGVEDWVMRRTGRSFDVDACADPEGVNSHCELFWSGADSCLDHDMGGRSVWAFPPETLLGRLLLHFREGATARPYDTTGVFVVPARTDAAWWRRLKGFRILGRIPSGSAALVPDPGSASSGAREADSLLVWWEPACRDSRARGYRAAPDFGADAEAGGDLFGVQLSGDGARDAEHLRGL